MSHYKNWERTTRTFRY